MNGKWILGIAAFGLTACTPAASLADPHSRLEYAPVVDVIPLVRVVRVQHPRRECWQETHYETIRYDSHYGGGGGRYDVAGPTIAGGLLGGVIGRQFGGGKGRDAMTAVGALVGASLGTQSALNRGRYDAGRSDYATRPVTVERCSTHTSYTEEERIDGYRVTYLYGGREHVTTTSTHPGGGIPLRVQVKPARH